MGYLVPTASSYILYKISQLRKLYKRSQLLKPVHQKKISKLLKLYNRSQLRIRKPVHQKKISKLLKPVHQKNRKLIKLRILKRSHHQRSLLLKPFHHQKRSLLLKPFHQKRSLLLKPFHHHQISQFRFDQEATNLNFCSQSVMLLIILRTLDRYATSFILLTMELSPARLASSFLILLFGLEVCTARYPLSSSLATLCPAAIRYLLLWPPSAPHGSSYGPSSEPRNDSFHFAYGLLSLLCFTLVDTPFTSRTYGLL